MKIKKLTLNNFMAFENAEINWSDNINIICGENSTGKTTLLKVMYKGDGRTGFCQKDPRCVSTG